MSTEIVVDDITWTRVWSDGMCDERGNFDGMTIQRVIEGPCKGRLAIHDMSGDTPSECNDGVLWIDERACLKLVMPDVHVGGLTYDCTPRVKFLCRHGDPDTGNIHHVSASARSLWLLIDVLESFYKKPIAVDIEDEAYCFYRDYGKTAATLNRTKRPAEYNEVMKPNYLGDVARYHEGGDK